MTLPTPIALTHRRVLHIAVPVVLSNTTVPILGAVDTAVVGQMGLAAPIGAVGIGAIILSAVYWIFGFLRMGTAGLTAQAIGAGDKGETSALLVRALMISVAAGFVFIAFQIPLFWAAFKLAPASPEVEGMAREYPHLQRACGDRYVWDYGLVDCGGTHPRGAGSAILAEWIEYCFGYSVRSETGLGCQWRGDGDIDC